MTAAQVRDGRLSLKHTVHHQPQVDVVQWVTGSRGSAVLQSRGAVSMGRRMQSRAMSAVEAAANVGSGMVVAFCLGLVVYPWFGFTPSAAQNASITMIFTGVSVVRSYAWRRAFNRLHRRAPQREGRSCRADARKCRRAPESVTTAS